MKIIPGKESDRRQLPCENEVREAIGTRLKKQIRTERLIVVYRVELSFDTEKLDQETVEKMCARTDEIFESEELDCAERQPGKRIYLDR